MEVVKAVLAIRLYLFQGTGAAVVVRALRVGQLRQVPAAQLQIFGLQYIQAFKHVQAGQTAGTARTVFRLRMVI
jgi:hypothetical protein